MSGKMSRAATILKLVLGLTFGIAWFTFWIAIGRIHFIQGDIIGIVTTVVFMLLPMIPVVEIIMRRNDGPSKGISST